MIEIITFIILGIILDLLAFSFWYGLIYEERFLPLHQQLPRVIQLTVTIAIIFCGLLAWLPLLSCFIGD